MSIDKEAINKEKAKIIADLISTPEGRIILEAHMWNPLPMGNDARRRDETELEWAKRVMRRFSDKTTEQVTKI